jgi:hypothetical protein
MKIPDNPKWIIESKRRMGLSRRQRREMQRHPDRYHQVAAQIPVAQEEKSDEQFQNGPKESAVGLAFGKPAN